MPMPPGQGPPGARATSSATGKSYGFCDQEAATPPLGQIEVHKIRGNPPPCAPSSTAHPLAHLPEQFDGTCGPAAQAFLQQTGLYCLTHPGFPDDHRKIIQTFRFNGYFLDPEGKVLHPAVQHPRLQFCLEQQYPGEPLLWWIEGEHPMW
ncbi:uncharacterized protein VP01_436g2 [Puccinia sorghi]|uniref:Uncharacterized protein n=1 Tax=Puccinia sorghi TaxID=27349 RepID=A0A0L6UQL4_9BASI|nr:uncharacterized protein VP01_436g2 [Puccinia sorghi]